MFTKWLIILNLIAISCSPAGDKEDSSTPPTVQRDSDKELDSVELPIERLTRRAALDIVGQLPELDEIEAVTTTPARLSYIIDNYVNSTRHSEYFSAYFRLIWRLSKYSLPDLQRYINQGDTSLESDLTAAVRTKINEDTGYILKSLMDYERPFKDLFLINFSIGDTDLLNFWSLSGTSLAWLGTDLFYANYSDNRPNAGLLGNQSFLSHFDSRQETIPYTRTYDLLKTMTCISQEDVEAHRFTEVEPQDIVTSLRAASTQNKICGSCHTSYHHVSHLFSGLATGANFGNFIAYNDTPAVLTTRFLGRDISSLSDMARLMAINPAVHRCQIKQTIENLLQKNFSVEFNATTLNEVHESFVRGQFQLKNMMPAIVQSSVYKLGPFHSKTSARASKELSGVRFLNQFQWRGIIRQLGYDVNQFEIDGDLSVSYFEQADQRSYFPQPAYWQATQRIAIQLASSIINRELTATSSAERDIFASLADDIESTSDETVMNQIIQLVKRLTSVYDETELEALSEDLLDLWEKTGGESTDANSHRVAWEAVMRAILMSPQFITY